MIWFRRADMSSRVVGSVSMSKSDGSKRWATAGGIVKQTPTAVDRKIEPVSELVFLLFRPFRFAMTDHYSHTGQDLEYRRQPVVSFRFQGLDPDIRLGPYSIVEEFDVTLSK